MKARIKLIEGAAWASEADSGHGLVVDGSPEIGGRNLGPRPMELVLQGLCACSGMDVVSILRKQRQDVVDVVIEAEAERAETAPRVFTRIALTYRVFGRGLRPKAVERAVRLSADTYCSVSKMLSPTVAITDTIEIVEVDRPADGSYSDRTLKPTRDRADRFAAGKARDVDAAGGNDKSSDAASGESGQ